MTALLSWDSARTVFDYAGYATTIILALGFPCAIIVLDSHL